jgi:hypothetical protein
MSKRTKLFAVGILVTPLLLFFVAANWENGYFVTILVGTLFPYAGTEMYIERALSEYNSLNPPTLLGIFLAAIQYPIYGWLLGRAWDRKQLRAIALVVLVCHFAVSATYLIPYLYQTAHND